MSTNPAQKALWYIESHLSSPLSLDEIAHVAGVSRFHIVRAFAAATGLSVMRYVRLRRLSEAARELANGAPDILSVALAADYGSHEAFTRAFRDQFGVTPESVRAAARLDGLALQEPILMDQTLLDDCPAPRFVTSEPLLVAGLGERVSVDNGAGIPMLWRRFNAITHEVPARRGTVAYGVCCNGDDAGNFDYVAGVEVADFSDLPRTFSRVRVPPATFAVFTHAGHISSIRRTVHTIWNRWLPQSGYAVADAPNFERYDQRFDPLSGHGGLEIWLPLIR
ncbi:putative transcriptional regulator AraC/XylS family, with a AraC_E_bind effector binding domain [Bradyrhizobium sp. ORS 278]|uniref:AraC family transcriptional regulator n=1 Tax=Bradyrhizobium sp. (strain ORS 278) TaxID=114615 RepID=UPI00015083BE|nr:AraC family transcriptional regulator [Bradyrhizobium sp. ORS 278]CAL79431.1 putative transcriptional regulator AraC/XylS family, with a AraC_E_bind effector binding domain [Bradyrhizobium sp. ORS 278]